MPSLEVCLADGHTQKHDHGAGEQAAGEAVVGQCAPALVGPTEASGWRRFQHLWVVVEITCFLSLLVVAFFPAGPLAWPGYPLAESLTDYHFSRYLLGRHSPVLIACFLAGGLGLVFFVPVWPRAGSRGRRGWCLAVSLSVFLFLLGTYVLIVHYSVARE
jgi:hypothetical protein